mgnify:CR=1 FL=1
MLLAIEQGNTNTLAVTRCKACFKSPLNGLVTSCCDEA